MKPVASEAVEAKALIRWAQHIQLSLATKLNHAIIAHNTCRSPMVADYLIHIPNGGRRDLDEARSLSLQGVHPGVSDYLLALPVGNRHGLWIELKRIGGRPTTEQIEWITRMQRAHYEACWVQGWTEAANVIADYLGLPSNSF